MIIYKAVNLKNGKCYFGKTIKTLDKRKKQHEYSSKTIDTVFYRAIRKYGFDSFGWEIIHECNNIDELNKMEIKVISENKNNYNIAPGGNGGDTISNHPNLEELKKRVSEVHKGKTLSDEHKQKISEAHKGTKKPWASDNGKKMAESNKGKTSKLKGKSLSEEHKEKIGKGNKGKEKVFTEEHKKNISKANKGKGKSTKGKTLEEIMGVERAAEFKQRQSEMRKGRKVSEETKKKISETIKRKKNGK